MEEEHPVGLRFHSFMKRMLMLGTTNELFPRIWFRSHLCCTTVYSEQFTPKMLLLAAQSSDQLT